MSWRDKVFQWKLNRIGHVDRTRRGCSLSDASSVGLLYQERDHAHYREVKAIAADLQKAFGLRRVAMLSFVPLDSKETPSWLVKKLDSGFFCKSDLNWYGMPVNEVDAFISTPWDILIDLELSPVMPLKYVVKMSQACMKVGADHPKWNGDLDLRLVVEQPKPAKGDAEELDIVLQDPMEDWRRHTERTLRLLNEMDLK